MGLDRHLESFQSARAAAEQLLHLRLSLLHLPLEPACLRLSCSYLQPPLQSSGLDAAGPFSLWHFVGLKASQSLRPSVINPGTLMCWKACPLPNVKLRPRCKRLKAPARTKPVLTL